MLVLIFSVNTQAQLYVNEFMASNSMSFPGPEGDYPDWIEIYNAGNEAVNLSGYYLSDVLDDPEAMYQIPGTYPDSVTVAAGSFILFYANKGEESSVLNLNFKLSGGGESIGLWNAESVILDSFTYGDQSTDISYGRYPDGTDTWEFMTDITPGSSNIYSEPASVELFINEFMASNDDAFPGPEGDFPDWIEIYNAGTEAVNLAGYFILDTLDVSQAYQIPATYPDSVTVEAGGFIVFYANKDEDLSVLNLDFKLSGSGEQIGLWNPSQTLLDGLTYDEQISDTSYGRFADGSNNWYFMPDFTPNQANRFITSVDENISQITLKQNYPNPFNKTTNIEFDLKTTDHVTITVYSVKGSVYSVLTDKKYSAGNHKIVWDASQYPAGYYFYSVKTSEFLEIKKAILIK